MVRIKLETDRISIRGIFSFKNEIVFKISEPYSYTFVKNRIKNLADGELNKNSVTEKISITAIDSKN